MDDIRKLAYVRVEKGGGIRKRDRRPLGGGCKEEKGEDREGGERECRSLSRVHSLRAGEATTLATSTVVAHNISSSS